MSVRYNYLQVYEDYCQCTWIKYTLNENFNCNNSRFNDSDQKNKKFIPKHIICFDWFYNDILIIIVMFGW